ncbi:MAG: GTP-binding protein, partial [Planctomycetes bacterium]|nr:GTP-binding protein [Planctomycetota bacterium]
LANAITGHSQSVVADLPGTTRDWTVKLTDIEGIAISLIDTAGRRATGDLLERSAITRTDQQVQKADLVILLLEAGSNQAEHLQPPKDTLKNNPNVLIVCNKSDLLKSTDTHEKYLHISARTGHNLDRLKKTIAARLGFESFDPQRPLIFTDRQYKLLTKLTTAQDVNSAIETLNTLIGQSPALTN